MKVWPIIQGLGQDAIEAAVPIAEAALASVLGRSPFSAFQTEADVLIEGAAKFIENEIQPKDASVAVAHVVQLHKTGLVQANGGGAAGGQANTSANASASPSGAHGGTTARPALKGNAAASDIATKAVKSVREAHPNFTNLQLVSEALLAGAKDFDAANIGHDEASAAIAAAVGK